MSEEKKLKRCVMTDEEIVKHALEFDEGIYERFTQKIKDKARSEIICVSCEKRVAMKNNSLCSQCAWDFNIENRLDDHERRIKKLEKGA